MPATTVLDGAEFAGRTQSFTRLPRSSSWPSCKRCGSTLVPARFESSGVRTIAGSRMTVDTYRCRCGRGQQVRRAAA
jgi:hypothetical protein